MTCVVSSFTSCLSFFKKFQFDSLRGCFAKFSTCQMDIYFCSVGF